MTSLPFCTRQDLTEHEPPAVRVRAPGETKKPCRALPSKCHVSGNADHIEKAAARGQNMGSTRHYADKDKIITGESRQGRVQKADTRDSRRPVTEFMNN